MIMDKKNVLFIFCGLLLMIVIPEETMVHGHGHLDKNSSHKLDAVATGKTSQNNFGTPQRKTTSETYIEVKSKLLEVEPDRAREEIHQLKRLLKEQQHNNDDKPKAKLPLSFKGHKLIHLDLKGAPPKIPYLIELMPYFKRWGATGLLVEYEDMFPYSGELDVLKTSYAYSKSEIHHFLKECDKHSLMVVPLIQSFGHFQFVLKHKKFAHLSLIPSDTASLSPLHNESVPLVKKMFDQVLALHPNIKYFHVGADEVSNLKSCPKCKADPRSGIRLFMDHMKPILKHLKEKNITALMWDDMMRYTDSENLKELGELMEPMVWSYSNAESSFSPELRMKYAAVFPKVWGASAFKGATVPTTNYVPIKSRLQNNLDWLDIVTHYPRHSTVEGMALTGWSRFNHFEPMCELLPAGLPSLAFCLETFNNGYMDKNLEKKVTKELGLPDDFSIEAVPYIKKSTDPPPSFPGDRIFTLVAKLEQAYNVMGSDNQKALKLFKELQNEVQETFLTVYDDKIVKEWVENKITTKITTIENELKKTTTEQAIKQKT